MLSKLQKAAVIQRIGWYQGEKPVSHTDLEIPIAVGWDGRLLEISEGQVSKGGPVRRYRRLVSQNGNVNFGNWKRNKSELVTFGRSFMSGIRFISRVFLLDSYFGIFGNYLPRVL